VFGHQIHGGYKTKTVPFIHYQALANQSRLRGESLLSDQGMQWPKQSPNLSPTGINAELNPVWTDNH